MVSTSSFILMFDIFSSIFVYALTVRQTDIIGAKNLLILDSDMTYVIFFLIKNLGYVFFAMR